MKINKAEIEESLNNLIANAIEKKNQHDLAKGWFRYEKLRTLNIVNFSSLQRRNLEGERWDDMIDRLIVEEYEASQQSASR